MKKVIQYLGAGLLGIGALVAQTQTAKAESCELVTVSEGGPFNVVWVTCRQPVVINGNSVSIIGLTNSNPDIANRFMATGHAALLSGKRFWFEPLVATGTHAQWCPASNCRLPTKYGISD